MTDKATKGKKVFHLELLNEPDISKKNKFYTNLKSLCINNKEVVKRSYHHFVRFKDIDFPIKNDRYIITKGEMMK